MKLNVDAAFDSDSLQGAIGAILRDDRGAFIATMNEQLDVCVDAFMAEPMVLGFGLYLAQSVGRNRMIINSDNAHVITTMHEGGSFAGLAAAVFEDCYHMSTDFSRVIYEHCPREANVIAHELARFSNPETWLNEPPAAIQ